MSDTIYKKLRNDLKMSRDEVCDYISDNELGVLTPERLQDELKTENFQFILKR